MGNTKKLKKAVRLVRTGVSFEDAADRAGVPLPTLQGKMARLEEEAAREMAKLQERRLARLSDEELGRWNRLLKEGVSEAAAMAEVCPYPHLITKAEANARFDIDSKLESRGSYEGHVIVVRPSDLLALPGAWMSDDQFRALREFDCGYDVLTVVVDGDVTLKKEGNISDRLRTLIVAGDFTAPQLHVFETEVFVFGDLTVQLLTDHDDLVRVLGQAEVQKEATYDDYE